MPRHTQHGMRATLTLEDGDELPADDAVVYHVQQIIRDAWEQVAL